MGMSWWSNRFVIAVICLELFSGAILFVLNWHPITRSAEMFLLQVFIILGTVLFATGLPILAVRRKSKVLFLVWLVVMILRAALRVASAGQGSMLRVILSFVIGSEILLGSMLFFRRQDKIEDIFS